MARLNYSDIPNTQGNNNQNQVGFFQLKNDGDTAIVRIMHNSVEDFDLLSVHTLQLGNKYRKVNCLRSSPYEAISNCPFCEINKPVAGRFFVHMLQYSKDNQGNTVVKPVIWDRSKNQLAPKLKSLIEEYGPLSQRLFKIKRTGMAGAKNTTYDLIPCDRDIYNDANYPNVPNAFSGYDVLGTMVLNKNSSDMVFYIQNGNFPNKQATSYNAEAPAYTPAPPQPNNSPVPPVPNNYNAAPAPQAPATYNNPAPNVPNAPAYGGTPTYGAPTGAPNAAPSRPSRYY